MQTGIGVGVGFALMAIALTIQMLGLLPEFLRLRLVAVLVLLGMASAIVPTVIGQKARDFANWCVDQIASWVKSVDPSIATAIAQWALALLVLLAMVDWLVKFLPAMTAPVVGDAANRQFKAGDYLSLWGSAFVIAVLWASAPGPLGHFLQTPILALTSRSGPIATRLLGA